MWSDQNSCSWCGHACMLSRLSHVQLCATLWTAAHQAPPFTGFSRQEYWSGLPFPSSMYACMHAKLLQSCLTLCDPMDSSPPGSSVHRILQARTLEWVAISFSTKKASILKMLTFMKNLIWGNRKRYLCCTVLQLYFSTHGKIHLAALSKSEWKTKSLK